jgi:hypothetical protein
MFRRIGVPIDLLETARIERVSDRNARERFGIQGPASRDMAGLVFPYYSHITRQRVTARVRRDHPEIENGRPKNKYVSPYGDPRHLYFPPGAAEKLKSPEMPIVLVEAEKSALALTSWSARVGMELLAIGMGGCWSWRGRIGRTDSADGSRVDVTGPLPDLSVCDHRRVYVVMDANVAGNARVRQAEKALATCLAEHGCEVLLRHLPHLDRVNGPDDLIAVQGDDALRLVLTTPTCSSDGPGILEAAMEAIAGQIYASDRERFCAFCVAMQRLRGPQPPALPVKRIAELFGCHYTTIAMYRREGVTAGWLQRSGRAIPHVRAATFLVNLPILTSSESPLTKSKTKHMGRDSYSPSSENSSYSHSEKFTESPSEKGATSLSDEAALSIVRNPHSEDLEAAPSLPSSPTPADAVGGCPSPFPSVSLSESKSMSGNQVQEAEMCEGDL